MTPIEKNIIVVDENGKEYGATYPKRARGLVKNGRARFISENKICLACPPDRINSEDNEVSENTENKNVAENTTVVQSTENTPTVQSAEKLTIDYILTQIEKIMADTAYISEALNTIALIQDTGPGDERPRAAADIVRCRETTNQQTLMFYQRIYDDLKPKEPSFRDRALETAKVFAEQGLFDEFSGLVDTLRHC